MIREKTFEEMFWKRTRQDGDCLLFTGTLSIYGYGYIQWKGKRIPAHRYSYSRTKEIPDGLFILHHCDNKACVKPEHLYAGTHADNMRDASERKRFNHAGVHNGAAKFTPEFIDTIRNLKGTLSSRKAAALLGVSKSHVSAIWRGDRWSHRTKEMERGMMG